MLLLAAVLRPDAVTAHDPDDQQQTRAKRGRHGQDRKAEKRFHHLRGGFLLLIHRRISQPHFYFNLAALPGERDLAPEDHHRNLCAAEFQHLLSDGGANRYGIVLFAGADSRRCRSGRLPDG